MREVCLRIAAVHADHPDYLGVASVSGPALTLFSAELVSKWGFNGRRHP
ncbi:hypothetical protein ABZ353_09285 [Streptomyces niveus]